MSRRKAVVPTLAAEVAEADLGDVRLNRRLSALASSLADRAGDGFPKALDDAELEAAYRFFGNERVTPEAILAPHFRESAKRAARHPNVLVVHDTSQFEFNGTSPREGLGRLVNPGQGFFGHFTLAITADESREPLGLLAVETIFRLDKAKPKSQRRSSDSRGESARWPRGIEAAEGLLGGATRAIHVMDREGDSFPILECLCDAGRSFVIRAFRNRVLVGEHEQRLRDAAKAAKRSFEREVPLSRRPRIPGAPGKRHPARRGRIARLSFSATTVEIPKTAKAKGPNASTIKVNVVYIVERRPPPGEPPVEWFLLTDLPVASTDQIAFVVDCYRGRWMIEEYFKALKTGCQYEKRQLESAHSLLNAMAVLAPVAWRLLLLRHLARHAPERSASAALTSIQLDVLRAVAKRPMPARPTVKDAMLAVAGLGGHLPRNGDPGWLVLGRGMHDLLLLELGWRAREQM
jgi:Transposase DNA-binding